MMPAISEDQKAIWKAVLADPADPAPKLALADYLAEYGLDRPFEVGLRYCAKKNKWPHRQEGPWGKWIWVMPENPRRRRDRLPRKLDDWIVKHCAIRQSDPAGNQSYGWDAWRPETLIRRLGRAIIALEITI